MHTSVRAVLVQILQTCGERRGSYGLCHTNYGTSATKVLLTCANRAFLNRTYNMFSPCEFKIKDKIVTGRKVWWPCSKFTAAVYARVYGRLVNSKDGLALSVQYKTYRLL